MVAEGTILDVEVMAADQEIIVDEAIITIIVEGVITTIMVEGVEEEIILPITIITI